MHTVQNSSKMKKCKSTAFKIINANQSKLKTLTQNYKHCCSSSKPSYLVCAQCDEAQCLIQSPAKHGISSHCTLDVNDYGVTDQLSLFFAVVFSHRWLLHLRRAGLVHQSRQGRERLLLLDDREGKETDVKTEQSQKNKIYEHTNDNANPQRPEQTLVF